MNERFARYAAALALLALCAFGVGCDELEGLDPQEQQIVLFAANGECSAPGSLSTVDVCHDDPADFSSTVALIATAFDENDGSVAPGIDVSFTADRGALSSATSTTDERGQACVEVVASHVLGDLPVRVQALHPNGQLGQAELPWPPTPDMILGTGGLFDFDQDGTLDPVITPTDRDPNFDVVVAPSRTCRLTRFEGVITYDPAFMDYIELPPDDQKGKTTSLELGNSIETMLNVVDDGMGRITVEYFQDDPEAEGVNFGGTFDLLAFEFVPIAEGQTQIALESYTMTGLDGIPFQSVAVDPVTYTILAVDPP